MICATPLGLANLTMGVPTRRLLGDHGEVVSMDWILKELRDWNASMARNSGEGSGQDYFMGKGKGY